MTRESGKLLNISIQVKGIIIVSIVQLISELIVHLKTLAVLPLFALPNVIKSSFSVSRIKIICTSRFD